MPKLATPVLSFEPGGGLPAASETKVTCCMGGSLVGSAMDRPFAAVAANAAHILRSFLLHLLVLVEQCLRCLRIF